MNEFVLLTPLHVDVLAVLEGAASVDPELGLRQIWDGGALEIVDDSGTAVLTLLQSRRLDVVADAERILGVAMSDVLPGLDGASVWWSEAFVPAQPPLQGEQSSGRTVLSAVARAARGAVIARRGGS